MILTPTPLQRPSANAAVVRAPRSTQALPQRQPVSGVRPVLQPSRAPRQLCLDLQPRLR
jgi:hypothetical protein